MDKELKKLLEIAIYNGTVSFDAVDGYTCYTIESDLLPDIVSIESVHTRTGHNTLLIEHTVYMGDDIVISVVENLLNKKANSKDTRNVLKLLSICSTMVMVQQYTMRKTGYIVSIGSQSQRS